MYVIEKEIEFKNLLLQEEYNNILKNHFQNDVAKTQTNYYIDNDDLTLINNRLMLRIRTKDGRQMMTLKVPEGQNVVYEYSGEVDVNLNQGSHIDESIIPESIKTKLNELNIEMTNFSIQGSLITERLEKAYRSGLLVLDKSTYLGQTDYELEFEAPDTASGQADINHILSEYGIVRREETVKSARFFQVLTNQKEGY